LRPHSLKSFSANFKSWLRFLAGLLSRIPSGAYLLSLLYFYTSIVRTGRRVKVFCDGRGWYRVENKVWIALGPIFPLGTGLARDWQPDGEDVFALRRKWWVRHYHPHDGDVILDVGAGLGEDTWVFSKAVGPKGKVVSVEAHPTTFQFLKDFVRYNHLHNVVPCFFAASGAGGSVIISDNPPEDWQLNSISSVDFSSSQQGHRVPAQRIDDLAFISQIPRLAFMKMNIEGAELLALEGAEKTLAKTQHVCVCCHDFLGPASQTKQRVVQNLSRAGFVLYDSPPGSPPYEQDFVYGRK